MSATVTYLCAKTNFEQVSEAIPITKQRNPEKFDPPDVFEGQHTSVILCPNLMLTKALANKKEMVADLMTKAKQVEALIRSLPVPESEEAQVSHVRKDEQYRTS